MQLPDKLDHLIARSVPRTSVTGDYMTHTATRAMSRVAIAALALAAWVGGILLLGSEWRGVIAGALLAWAVSAAVWSWRSFGDGQDEIREEIRRAAELDVLHARLNMISAHLGLELVNLNEQFEPIVRARMERIAHH